MALYLSFGFILKVTANRTMQNVVSVDRPVFQFNFICIASKHDSSCFKKLYKEE